ncbi:hypothetical protein HF086_000372 [Spodoptera exigua]|uniref:Uncharacterized protein n=1 Tax=Spodoptera exigua TaxID=7107 RepID=A0A922M9S9_SPOEX|nr:hypothetical protein HF086_000372 [Spodoptera exigua]
MRHSRSSKIISLVPSTSSSQESNSTNHELSKKENSALNDEDFHNYEYSSDFLDFDSDDSVFDENYLPLSSDLSKCSEDSDSSTNTIPCSQSKTIPESPEVSNGEDMPESLTKKGTIRKRKKYDESPAQRKETKRLKDMESKYQLKPGCNDSFSNLWPLHAGHNSIHKMRIAHERS